MNLLMQLVALPPEHAIPVLHAESCAGERVMLGDRDIDDLVDIQEGIEHLPRVQNFSLEIHFLEHGRFGKNNFGSRDSALPRRCRIAENSGVASLQLTSVTMIRFAPAFEHWRTNFGDDVGISVGRLLRSAVPADIGLHQDHVSARDEAAHSSQLFDCLPRQFRGIVAVMIAISGNFGSAGYGVAVLRGHCQVRLRAQLWLLSQRPSPAAPAPAPATRSNLISASRRLRYDWFVFHETSVLSSDPNSVDAKCRTNRHPFFRFNRI